jgi:hypothetical protein
MTAETADYLAKARATLADAEQIAALPLPHVAARHHHPIAAARLDAVTRPERAALTGCPRPGSKPPAKCAQ